jgi:uncharacterized protein (DUF2147 family)
MKIVIHMKPMNFVIVMLLFWLHPLQAGEPIDIGGKWLTPKGISIVQIKLINGQYRGEILSIHPKAFVNGKVPKDLHNSDPALRSRKLEGLIIMSGFSYNEKKERWEINQIYEPERGKYFEGYVTLDGPDKLSVRGHVPGKKWLGSTEVWKRVK